MCTTSLDRAKHIAEELADSFLYADECNKGILVGGMLSNTVHLGRHDIQLIKDCLGSVGGEISEVVSSFPSMFKPLHGPQGMLYRKEEVVMLVDGNDAMNFLLKWFVFCALLLMANTKNFSKQKSMLCYWVMMMSK